VSVVVLGLNHRTVPLRLLERVMVPGHELAKALHDVGSRSNVSEAVVLSTCNRTEVYVVAERFHGAYADLRDFFCDLGSLAPEELHDHLYSQHDDDAVRHLFEVAAGLDSDVLGETEILGQVKEAWEVAREAGTARASLNLLFRHAVEVGKRARTETAIARSTASVSHAAVELATELLGGLTGRRVLVVGAGEMGEGMVVALASAGVAEVVVANRTVANGERLAARVGGRAVGFHRLAPELEHADVLLASTGAGSIVVEHDLVAGVMAGRSNRPLLVVDIGVPRDVDPAVATISGVTIRDLDDLRDWAARGLAERRVEAEAVREIVAEEVHRFVELATARQVAPLVASLHDRAEQLRAAEVERFRSRLDGLSERERDAVEALTRGLVAKLLHEPSVRLKEQAGSPRGERNASALRDLFDLDH
jgi:glutamyl-tRNA reductase